jgi:predicted secreted Zn-dependent protease
MTFRRSTVALLAMLAAPALGAPTLVERTVEYEITGRDSAALARAVEMLGPRDDQGVARAAHTRYDATWRYGYRSIGGRCTVTSVEVRVEIVVTLPRWTDPERAKPDLRQRWDDYRAALARHEEGHAALAREMSQRLDDALWRAKGKPDCAGFASELEALAQQALADDRARQDAYDATTERGAAQGAVFP